MHPRTRRTTHSITVYFRLTLYHHFLSLDCLALFYFFLIFHYAFPQATLSDFDHYSSPFFFYPGTASFYHAAFLSITFQLPFRQHSLPCSFYQQTASSPKP